MRRIMGKFGTQAYKDEGLAGLRKMLALSGGAGEDQETTWKYKQLGLLPEGTVGRELWEHFTTNRFAFLMFVIIQFHLGVKVTPVTDGYTGLFDVPKVLRAAQRGAACKVDLSDHFDLFAVADAPVEQLRAEYGVPPL
jgi:hypothetical protein